MVIPDISYLNIKCLLAKLTVSKHDVHFGSMKGGECVDLLNNWQIQKKKYTARSSLA
jgi:hypothetical protein